jgi:hypothetical protein
LLLHQLPESVYGSLPVRLGRHKMQNRAIQLAELRSRKSTAAIDSLCAICLCSCDCFVTDDSQSARASRAQRSQSSEDTSWASLTPKTKRRALAVAYSPGV